MLKQSFLIKILTNCNSYNQNHGISFINNFCSTKSDFPRKTFYKLDSQTQTIFLQKEINKILSEEYRQKNIKSLCFLISKIKYNEAFILTKEILKIKEFFLKNENLFNMNDILLILRFLSSLKKNFFLFLEEIIILLENRTWNLIKLDLFNKNTRILSKLIKSFHSLDYKVKNKEFYEFFESEILKDMKRIKVNLMINFLFFFQKNKFENYASSTFLQNFKNYYLQEGRLSKILKIKNRLKNLNFSNNFRKNLTVLAQRLFLTRIIRTEPRYVLEKKFNFVQTLKILAIFKNFKEEKEFTQIVAKNLYENLVIYYDDKIQKNIKSEKKMEKFFRIMINEIFSMPININDERNNENTDYFLQTHEGRIFFEMTLNFWILNINNCTIQDIFQILIICSRKTLAENTLREKINLLMNMAELRAANFFKKTKALNFYSENDPLFILRLISINKNIFPEEKRKEALMKMIINLPQYTIEKRKKTLSILSNLIPLLSLSSLLIYVSGEIINDVNDFENLLEFINLISELFYLETTPNLIHCQSILLEKLINLDFQQKFNFVYISKILMGLISIQKSNVLKKNDQIFPLYLKIQKFSFRFIADHYEKLDIKIFQEIMLLCFKLEEFEERFDDGSELYKKNILDETKSFVEKSWNMMDEKFRMEYCKIIKMDKLQ